MTNQPYTTLDPNIDQSKVIAAKDKEIARLEQLNEALNNIDDVAGDWKKIAEEQQKLMNDIYQELSAAEAETMGDHSPYFKAKIELINERIEEVGK